MFTLIIFIKKFQIGPGGVQNPNLGPLGPGPEIFNLRVPEVPYSGPNNTSIKRAPPATPGNPFSGPAGGLTRPHSDCERVLQHKFYKIYVHDITFYKSYV